MSEIIFRSAADLARAIREGRLSAVEVLEAHLDHIQRYNPQLNAVVTLDDAPARQRATEADAAMKRGDLWGPLHGVPMTVKEHWATAGLRTTASSKAYADHVPREDATAVARLRAAGAIIMGKTNMPESGLDLQTNSPLFGIANNPWDVTRTPGGSSGGAAAAVASGMTPLELVSDLAGSIRAPAHFCGVFAIRTTDNRVPATGSFPQRAGMPRTFRYMSAYGPMARTIEDLRLGLRVIAGPDGVDTEIPPVPLGDPPRKSLTALRLAWTDDFGGVPISADTRAALHRLVDDLSKAGCQIERGDPGGFDLDSVWKTWGEMLAVSIAPLMPMPFKIAMRALGGRRFAGTPMLRAAAAYAFASTTQYHRTLTRRGKLIQALEAFLADYDAWLCPVVPIPAFRHCTPGPFGEPITVDDQMLPYWTALISYAIPFNLTGSPAVVIPIGQSREGLPIGIQIVGRRWDDMAVLNVAETLTEITGPFRPPPGYAPTASDSHPSD